MIRVLVTVYKDSLTIGPFSMHQTREYVRGWVTPSELEQIKGMLRES